MFEGFNWTMAVLFVIGLLAAGLSIWEARDRGEERDDAEKDSRMDSV